MTQITKTNMFQRAIATLSALESQGLKFKVLVDNQEFGSLTVSKPKTQRKFIYRAYGGRNNYLGKKLGNIIPGQVEVLEVPDFVQNRSAFAQSISSWCYNQWGKGAAMINSNGNSVEVLRIK